MKRWYKINQTTCSIKISTFSSTSASENINMYIQINSWHYALSDGLFNLYIIMMSKCSQRISYRPSLRYVALTCLWIGVAFLVLHQYPMNLNMSNWADSASRKMNYKSPIYLWAQNVLFNNAALPSYRRCVYIIMSCFL